MKGNVIYRNTKQRKITWGEESAESGTTFEFEVPLKYPTGAAK